MAQPCVISVVLNTNRRDDTVACVASLINSRYENHSIIVLDNDSVDGSVEAITAAFPTVQVIPLTENLGYAGNNNIGIRAALAAGADWVLVLNEDTVLDPDCIPHLVREGERNAEVGIVGPMIYHYNEPDCIQSAGGTLGRTWTSSHLAQNELNRGQFVQPHRVEWVSGCALLVRRALIEQVGAFDERFFYYWEETEWCVRAARHGWRILHVPQAKLWHKGVQRDYRPSPSVTYYSTRNRFLILATHRAPPLAWMVAWEQTLRTLASWTLRPRWRAMRQHRDAMWQGTLDFVRGRWGMRPT